MSLPHFIQKKLGALTRDDVKRNIILPQNAKK